MLACKHVFPPLFTKSTDFYQILALVLLHLVLARMLVLCCSRLRFPVLVPCLFCVWTPFVYPVLCFFGSALWLALDYYRTLPVFLDSDSWLVFCTVACFGLPSRWLGPDRGRERWLDRRRKSRWLDRGGGTWLDRDSSRWPDRRGGSEYRMGPSSMVSWPCRQRLETGAWLVTEWELELEAGPGLDLERELGHGHELEMGSGKVHWHSMERPTVQILRIFNVIFQYILAWPCRPVHQLINANIYSTNHVAATKCIKVCRHSQEVQLFFRPNVRKGKMLSTWLWPWNDYWWQTGWFEHLRNYWFHGFPENGAKNKKHPVSSRFCGQKFIVNERGQRRRARLVKADRKVTEMQNITRYNSGMQNSISKHTTRQTSKSIGYSSRRPLI